MTDWFYRLRAERQLERIADQKISLESDAFAAQTVLSCISPGTETAAYAALTPLRAGVDRFPRLMGYMNVARVSEAGEATSTCPGDLVYTHKHHCSGFVGKDSDLLLKLRDEDLSLGIEVLYLYRLALNAVRRGNGQAGQDVLILGSGAIGLASADLAYALSMRAKILSDHDPVSDKCVELNIAHSSKSKAIDELDNMTGRLEGICDLVIVTSNTWTDWQVALRSVRFNGTIAVLGFPGRGLIEIPRNPLDSAFFYDRQITIVSCGFGQDQPMGAENEIAPPQTLQSDMAYLLELARAKRIRPKGLIGTMMAATDYPNALDTLIGSRDFAGTISLDWSS